MQTESSIHGFDTLRWDDQKQIKDKMTGGKTGIWVDNSNYSAHCYNYTLDGTTVVPLVSLCSKSSRTYNDIRDS